MCKGMPKRLKDPNINEDIPADNIFHGLVVIQSIQHKLFLCMDSNRSMYMLNESQVSFSFILSSFIFHTVPVRWVKYITWVVNEFYYMNEQLSLTLLKNEAHSFVLLMNKPQTTYFFCVDNCR